MNYTIPRITLLVCFVTLFTFNACNQNSSFNKKEALGLVDSVQINELEYDITFGKYDSALSKINEIVESPLYKNNKTYRIKVLEIKSKLYLKLKKYQNALDNINQLIGETEEYREYYNEAYVSANLLKGDVYFALGNYHTAYKYYYFGKASSEGENGSCTYAMYDYRISLLFYRQGKYIESAKNFKKAFSNYNTCEGYDFNVKYRQQEILSNIGLCYFKLEEFDSSLYYYNRALQHLQQIPVKDSSQRIYIEMAEGVIAGNMGKALIALKEYDQAIPLLKRNIEINSRVKYDNLDAITSIVALGNYYYNNKEFDKFLNIIDVPESYYKNPRYKEQILYIYQLRSKYFEQVNNHQQAFDNYKKYISIKDSLSIVRDEINNSDIQLSMETLEKENQINKLLKESQQRKFYIYITIYITIALIILIITISIFLRFSNKKNAALRESNEEVIRQKELLKKANDEITYNIEILKQRDTEKNKILSIVAHDLRNPNNAILSITQSLKEADNLTNEQIEYLNLVETSANSNNDLIQEILFFAKPGQFETQTEFKPTNCRDLIQQCISLNLYKASQKHINIVLEELDPRLEVNINQEKIRRAISNVIVNAIKFSHHHTKIKIYSTSTLEQVHIHIKDQGIGIPDRIKGAIFISDPIIRRLGTDGEASFGLGLAIVKQIIEEHGGKVSFISNIQGTEFTITLPLYKQNTQIHV